MKREDLVKNLDIINSKINQIESAEEVFLYVTKEKYVAGVGSIEDVSTLKDLVEFKCVIDTEFKSDISDTLKSLNLTPDELVEINNGGEKKYMGIKEVHWIKDIDTKLEELRYNSLYRKLIESKDKLEKHLSEDDKFKMDTEDIESVLAEC